MRKVRMVLGLISLGVSVSAWAADPPTPPPAPEIKKTVDAFVGTWNLKSSLTLPGGAAPIKFDEKIDCKKAVMGRAALCVDTYTVPGMGAMEYDFLVGWDVEGKAVH